MKCDVAGEVGYESCSGWGERTSVEYKGYTICSYCREEYTDEDLDRWARWEEYKQLIELPIWQQS